MSPFLGVFIARAVFTKVSLTAQKYSKNRINFYFTFDRNTVKNCPMIRETVRALEVSRQEVECL